MIIFGQGRGYSEHTRPPGYVVTGPKWTPWERLPVTGPSPCVRRRWLGQEVRRLRDEHRLSGEYLARALGFSRQQLSALENGRAGPDIDLVSGVCDYLRVSPQRREAIIDAATDGWATGWWMTGAVRIGDRQARYADLEGGTASISEYALALIPGLLQTAEFADARVRSDPGRQSDAFEPVAAAEARSYRLQLLVAGGGPIYDLLLDEFAVRRCAADPPVVAAQLRHITALCAAHRSITVRILSIGAAINGHSAPRSAYSIFQYRDVHATLAVAVDTLTTDLVLTNPAEVDASRDLHGWLTAAAVGPEASLHLLATVAQQLSRQAEGARSMTAHDNTGRRQSRRSDANGSRVEVAPPTTRAPSGVRDSKHRGGPFSNSIPSAWRDSSPVSGPASPTADTLGSPSPMT
jgi:transcriptional regulator with XRE-family HTH domain